MTTPGSLTPMTMVATNDLGECFVDIACYASHECEAFHRLGEKQDALKGLQLPNQIISNSNRLSGPGFLPNPVPPTEISH